VLVIRASSDREIAKTELRKEYRLMMLADTIESIMRDTAQKLTGYRHRNFIAKVAADYYF
jgi:hypothetical protein